MPRYKTRNIAFSVDCITNSGVIANNSASLNPTDVVALEIWIKPQAQTSTIVFDNSNAGTTNSYFLSIDGGARRISWFSNIGGTPRNIVNTPGIMPNAWNFVGASYDGTAVKVYSNGSQIATLACTGALGTNPGQLRIGQYFSAAVPSFNRATHARIYNRIYSLTDHQQRYYENRDDSTVSANVVLDMRMTDGSGTTVTDFSGFSNNGTFSRNVWSTDTPFKSRTATTGRVPTSGRVSSASRVLIT